MGSAASSAGVQKFRPALGISRGPTRAFPLNSLYIFSLLVSSWRIVLSILEQVARSSLVSVMHIRTRWRHSLIRGKAHVRRRAKFLLFCRTADVAMSALRFTVLCELRLDAGRFLRARGDYAVIHIVRFLFNPSARLDRSSKFADTIRLNLSCSHMRRDVG